MNSTPLVSASSLAVCSAYEAWMLVQAGDYVVESRTDQLTLIHALASELEESSE